jgi:hypothetical protein
MRKLWGFKMFGFGQVVTAKGIEKIWKLAVLGVRVPVLLIDFLIADYAGSFAVEKGFGLGRIGSQFKRQK